MLNFKEITDIDELKNLIVKSDSALDIPLLHGTRRYSLQISDEKRARFMSACHQVISFANKYYYSDHVDWDRLEVYHRDEDEQFLSTVVSQYNLSDYQYGDFYLTTSYETALDFSYYVGGELGSNAYSQIKGFEAWKIELDETTKAASKIVVEEYERYHNSDRIILAFFGVKLTDLYGRGGHPILMEESDEELREAKELYEDGVDTDSLQIDHQFRLVNPSAYTAYVICERNFRDGFSIFTNICDVDSAIKDHNYMSNIKWKF